MVKPRGRATLIRGSNRERGGNPDFCRSPRQQLLSVCSIAGGVKEWETRGDDKEGKMPVVPCFLWRAGDEALPPRRFDAPVGMGEKPEEKKFYRLFESTIDRQS